MKEGDLFRFNSSYKWGKVTSDSIGLIIEPADTPGFYVVFIDGENYLIPFQHIHPVKMNIGDLIKTIYSDEWAVITKIWQGAQEIGVQFVYVDGSTGVQPISKVREVISETR